MSPSFPLQPSSLPSLPFAQLSTPFTLLPTPHDSSTRSNKRSGDEELEKESAVRGQKRQRIDKDTETRVKELKARQSQDDASLQEEVEGLLKLKQDSFQIFIRTQSTDKLSKMIPLMKSDLLDKTLLTLKDVQLKPLVKLIPGEVILRVYKNWSKGHLEFLYKECSLSQIPFFVPVMTTSNLEMWTKLSIQTVWTDSTACLSSSSTSTSSTSSSASTALVSSSKLAAPSEKLLKSFESMTDSQMQRSLEFLSKEKQISILKELKGKQLGLILRFLPSQTIYDLVPLLRSEQLQDIVGLLPSQMLYDLIPLLNIKQLQIVFELLPISNIRRSYLSVTNQQEEAVLKEIGTIRAENLLSQHLSSLQIAVLSSEDEMAKCVSALTPRQVQILLVQLDPPSEYSLILAKITQTQLLDAFCCLNSEQVEYFYNTCSSSDVKYLVSKTSPNQFKDVFPKLLPKVLSQIIPVMNDRQLKAGFPSLKQQEFVRFINLLSKPQLIEVFTSFSLEQVGWVATNRSIVDLKYLIPIFTENQLQSVVSTLSIKCLNECIPIMKESQLWAIAKKLTDEQRRGILEEVSKYSDETFIASFDLFKSSELIISVTHQPLWNRIFPFVNRLKPNQLWLITPVMTATQLIEVLSALSDPHQINSVLSNITQEQKIGLTLEATSKIKLDEITALKLDQESKKILGHIEEFTKIILKLEGLAKCVPVFNSSSVDKDKTTEETQKHEKNEKSDKAEKGITKYQPSGNARKDFDSLIKIQGVVTNQLIRLTGQIHSSKNSLIAYKLLSAHLPQYLNTQIETIFSKFENLNESSINLRKNIDDRSEKTSLHHRYRKLVEIFDIKTGSAISGLGINLLYTAKKAKKVYEDVKAILDNVKGANESLTKGDYEVEDFINIGLTSLSSLKKLNIKKNSQLLAYVVNENKKLLKNIQDSLGAIEGANELLSKGDIAIIDIVEAGLTSKEQIQKSGIKTLDQLLEYIRKQPELTYQLARKAFNTIANNPAAIEALKKVKIDHEDLIAVGIKNVEQLKSLRIDSPLQLIRYVQQGILPSSRFS